MENKKLKTLKDLSARKEYTGDVEIGIIGYSNIIYVDKLKAEAVKWIKSNDKTTDGVRGWIKHFFNLTEEDLK